MTLFPDVVENLRVLPENDLEIRLIRSETQYQNHDYDPYMNDIDNRPVLYK